MDSKYDNELPLVDPDEDAYCDVEYDYVFEVLAVISDAVQIPSIAESV